MMRPVVAVGLCQLLVVVTSADTWSLTETGTTGPAGNVSSPCGRHLRHYEDNLFTQLWALQMFDATSKIPTGLLYGTPMDMGNFDECVQVTDVKTPEGDVFDGKHCLLTLAPNPPENKKASSINLMALDFRKMKNMDVRMGGGSKIPDLGGIYANMGACLPSTCTAEDFGIYFGNKMSDLVPGTSFTSDEVYCSDGKQDPFTPIDWFAVALFIVFGLAAISSTTYDLMTAKSNSRKELYLAFSWYTNGKKLLSTRTSAMDLSCLHGIRFLSMTWVVLIHRTSFNAVLPNTNQSELRVKLVNQWGYLFLQNGSLSVDSFFLLSGVLVAYVFLNSVHKGAKFNLFLYYLHRYIRLTPSLMVIMLLYVSLIRHMGSGPLWESNMPVTCNDLWWKHLLYINNYFSVDNTCIGQSWYLGVDMQLYWLSPLVLIPLWKKPRLGKALLGLFTLIGLAISFAICYYYKIVTQMKSAVGGGDDGWNFVWLYYNYTHTRFTPWLVGIAFGYVLHEIKKRPPNSFKMTPIQWLSVWALAFFFMLVSLCGTFPLNQPEHEYNVVEYSFYNTFCRPVWALGLGCMIFACSTGYGGPVDTFLSWSFFVPLSKLTYGIYLYHIAIQDIISLPMRNLIYSNDISTISDTFGDIVISTLVAIVISLVFESPFMILEKVLLVFDATSKIPTGLLYGYPMDMGNYDECIEVKDVETPDGDVFGGKHCLVTLQPSESKTGTSINSLALALRERRNMDPKMGGGSLIPGLGGIFANIGACLPSSCTAEDFGIYLQNKMSDFLPGTSFTADEGYCSDGKQDPFRPIDWIAIAIFIFFGLLAIASTTYDLMTTKSDSRKELYLAFSWYTNGKKLLSTHTSPMDLSCLHGIRFLSMTWVVLIHRFALNAILPNSNQSELRIKLINHWGYLFLQSGGLSVDSFFLLSGVLVAYVFLNSVHKGAKFNLFLYYFHRYIRLTPSLMVMMLIYVSLIKYMGSGPLWETYWPVKCDELWWKHMLYINNYFEVENTCVGQAWYLGADMQLYWLSPLVLIPLWKKPALGRVLLGLFTLIGLAVTFGICYHFKIVAHMTAAVEGGDVGWNWTWLYYNYTHTRFTPWLVGITFGYILHEVKKKPPNSFKMTPVQWLSVWALAFFFMLVSLCGTFPLIQPDHVYNVIETTFYNTFCRPVWALGLGFMIFACSTGYGGPIDAFLSWSFFVPLSKLTYGIYIYHIAMQGIISVPMRHIIYSNDIISIADTFGDIVFTALVAIVISLVFESPFMVLEKVLLGGRKGTNKKTTTAPAAEKTAVSEKSKVDFDPEIPPTIEDLPSLSNGSTTVNNSTANLLPH